MSPKSILNVDLSHLPKCAEFFIVLKTISDQNVPATVESTMSSDTFLFLILTVPLVGCLNKYITWRS